MLSGIIRAENLTKKFRRVEALNGLNLDVPDGAIYAERTSADIQNIFSNIRDIAFTPMSLRSIFLAMAKAGRGPA